MLARADHDLPEGCRYVLSRHDTVLVVSLHDFHFFPCRSELECMLRMNAKAEIEILYDGQRMEVRSCSSYKHS
jgi:hypothetical protein